MATTCRIIHSDLSDDGEFYATGSPTTTWDQDLTNLQDPLLSAVISTTVLAQAAVGLRFPSNVVAQGVAICGTNFSKNATFRVQAFTGSPGFETYNSGILPVSTSSKTIIDPDEKGFSFHHLFTQDVSASDFLFTFTDTGNSEGFLELSRILLGSVLASTFGFWDGAEFSRDHNTQVATSVGGARFYNKHRNIRKWSLSFPLEGYAKAWDEFDQMYHLNGLDRQVYVIGYPDDTERMHQHSFLATFEETSPLRQFVHLNVGTGLDVIEVV